MPTTTQVEIGLLEGLFRSAIENAGYKSVIIALSNACVHGEVFEDTDFEISDKDLAKMFDHYEALIEIAKKGS